MNVNPKEVIESLLYRKASNAVIWHDGDSNSFEYARNDRLSELYAVDSNTVIAVLQTLELMQLVKYGADGRMTFSRHFKKMLLNGD